MIGLKLNGPEFAQELEAELHQATEVAHLELTKRTARHVRNRAEELSPVGPGDRAPGEVVLKESWSVSIGEPALGRGRRGSDADAAATLEGLKPGESVFVQSSDFTSGFFEFGTEKMAPRPLAQPGIEESKGFVA